MRSRPLSPIPTRDAASVGRGVCPEKSGHTTQFALMLHRALLRRFFCAPPEEFGAVTEAAAGQMVELNFIA